MIPEANDPLIESWSQEDKDWLQTIPVTFHAVAKRHGRFTFAMTMNAGVSNHALEVLAKRCRGNNELMKAIQVIGTNFNTVFLTAMEGRQIAPEKFQECKADVERIGALAQPAAEGGQRRSPGGIILNS